MNSLKSRFLIWFIAFAVLLGPAYNLYLSYDYTANPDCHTYLAIANGEFKDQSLTRRYRVLVPFAAKAFALPIATIYTKLWPHRAASQWPLKLGFLAVNLLLMATVGLMIFLTCKAYLISDAGSALAMIAILCGGRWGNLFAAIPITDSLYLLILIGVVLAIKTGNNALLIVCIILGPIAKESFVFVIPLIFFFSNMSKWKQVIAFMISGMIVLGSRYWIDHIAGTSSTESLVNDANHIENIAYSLKRILAVRGLGELATVLGLFSVIIIIGFTNGKAAVKSWASAIDPLLWWFIPVMLLHAILSSEVARMLYLGSAVWAVMIGLIWDRHPFFVQIKKLFSFV